MLLPFKFPCRVLVSGSSQSGKTSLISQILLNYKKSFQPVPQRIIYCAKFKDSVPDEIKNIVEIINEIPTEDFFSNLDKNSRTLFILDDLMKESIESDTVLNLFLAGRHVGLGIIFLSQNIFSKGKYSRDISLNCNYIILMRNVRDSTQIEYLSRQIFPNEKHFLTDIFKKYLKQPYPYLCLDLTQDADEFTRVRCDILSWMPRCFITEEQFQRLKSENSDKIVN